MTLLVLASNRAAFEAWCYRNRREAHTAIAVCNPHDIPENLSGTVELGRAHDNSWSGYTAEALQQIVRLAEQGVIQITRV